LSSPLYPVLYRWTLLSQDVRHEQNVKAFSVKLRDETDLGAISYDSTSEDGRLPWRRVFERCTSSGGQDKHLVEETV
jgi:hypothetical protein